MTVLLLTPPTIDCYPNWSPKGARGDVREQCAQLLSVCHLTHWETEVWRLFAYVRHVPLNVLFCICSVGMTVGRGAAGKG